MKWRILSVQCCSMLNVFDPSAGRLPELLTSDLCRKKNILPFNQTRGRVSPFFFLLQPSSRDGNISKTTPFQTMNVRLVEKILLRNLSFFFHLLCFPFPSTSFGFNFHPLKGCILIIVHRPSRTSTYLSPR